MRLARLFRDRGYLTAEDWDREPDLPLADALPQLDEVDTLYFLYACLRFGPCPPECAVNRDRALEWLWARGTTVGQPAAKQAALL